ncbi:hypothetical protein ACP4OV_013914 [Aristida adscensionis]
MFEMKAVDLANIYVFLKCCQCPNLERLFMQLPESSYEPEESKLDEVGEESPDDSLDNLKMVRVMNFNGRRFEVPLVNFLLRKAASRFSRQLVVKS